MSENISSITKFPKIFDDQGVEIVRICATCHTILTPRKTGALGQNQRDCNRCMKKALSESK